MDDKWRKRHTCDEAELYVTLDKPTYDAVDTMTVAVRLVVLRPLAILFLSARLKCQEVIVWRRLSSISATQDALLAEEEADVPHHNVDCTVPGEHHLTVTFTVPSGIPQFHYKRDNCTVAIHSFVECLLWTDSGKATMAKACTDQYFSIRSPQEPSLATLQGPGQFKFMRKCDLRLLGLVPSGRCNVGIQLDRPGLQLNGDTIAIVSIDSPMPQTEIKSVSLSLLEEAQFHSKNKNTTLADVVIWEVSLEITPSADAREPTNGYSLESRVTLRVDPNTVHRATQLKLLKITHSLRFHIVYHGCVSGTVDFKSIPLLRD